MNFGANLLSIIPGRSEPSDKAEMVTQLLFGDLYTVLEERPKWILIKTHADEYTCWIDRKQHFPISAKEFERLRSIPVKRSTEITGVVHIDNAPAMRIPLGSALPGIDEKGIFEIDDVSYRFSGNMELIARADVANFSKKFLNAPYLWGGKSVFGIDCSGFVQLVFIAMGKQLPRDAYQQAEMGEDVPFINQAMAGDLAYFDNDQGKITHVGIITEPGKIIHASGKVRIDTLDHQGIYREDTREYTHKLRLIKRISLLPEKA